MAARIIEALGLEPHPIEGGFFRETYRSEEVIPATALRPPIDRRPIDRTGLRSTTC